MNPETAKNFRPQEQITSVKQETEPNALLSASISRLKTDIAEELVREFRTNIPGIYTNSEGLVETVAVDEIPDLKDLIFTSDQLLLDITKRITLLRQKLLRLQELREKPIDDRAVRLLVQQERAYRSKVAEKERLSKAQEEGIEIAGIDDLRNKVERLSLFDFYENFLNKIFQSTELNMQDDKDVDLYEEDFEKYKNEKGWNFSGRVHDEYEFSKGNEEDENYQSLSISRFDPNYRLAHSQEERDGSRFYVTLRKNGKEVSFFEIREKGNKRIYRQRNQLRDNGEFFREDIAPVRTALDEVYDDMSMIRKELIAEKKSAATESK